MFNPFFILLAGSVLFASCGRTRIVTDTAMEGGPDTSYSCGSQTGLSWKKVAAPTGAPAGKLLPRSYSLFAVTNAVTFFERAKSEEGEVLIPLPVGCIPFKTSPSGAMSAELQQKYPQLVSLKGSNGAGDDLRLDWNGTTFSGQVLTAAGGKTFLIVPFSSGPSANPYMVYDKADSRNTKQPFEGTPVNNRPVGEMQQQAVDK